MRLRLICEWWPSKRRMTDAIAVRCWKAGTKSFLNYDIKFSASIQPDSEIPKRLPVGALPIHLLYIFLPFILYRINDGSRSPFTQAQTWIVIYSWPNPPTTSWRDFIPLLHKTFFEVTSVQNAVSSQFQRQIAISSFSGLSPAALISVFNLSKKEVIALILAAVALLLLRCCGFYSATSGHHFKTSPTNPCQECY